MKVSELNPPELNEWVAKAEEMESCDKWEYLNMGSAGGAVLLKKCGHEDDKCYSTKMVGNIHGEIGGCPKFATNWSQGGPIIEREGIELRYWPTTTAFEDSRGEWTAEAKNWESTSPIEAIALTPLIAAMRAYVCSEFGEEVGED